MYMKRFKWLKMLDFTNISIDLIYGLPGQTMEDFKDTLEKALALEFTTLF